MRGRRNLEAEKLKSCVRKQKSSIVRAKYKKRVQDENKLENLEGLHGKPRR